MRIAQILNNKAHWIFEAKEMPNLPPDPEGNPILLIDITSKPEVREGWEYCKETGGFTEPIVLETPTDNMQDQIQGLQMALAELTILLAGGEA